MSDGTTTTMDVSIDPPLATLPLSKHKLVNHTNKRIAFKAATSNMMIELRPFDGFVPAHGSIEMTAQFSKAYKLKPTPFKENTRERFKVYFAPVSLDASPSESAKKMLKRMQHRRSLKLPVLILPSPLVDASRVADGLTIEPDVVVCTKTEHTLLNRTAYRIVYRAATSSRMIELAPYYGFIEPHGSKKVTAHYTKHHDEEKGKPFFKARFKIYYAPIPEGTSAKDSAKTVFSRLHFYNVLKLPVAISALFSDTLLRTPPSDQATLSTQSLSDSDKAHTAPSYSPPATP